MCLAHSKSYIERKSSVLATAGCLHPDHSKSFDLGCHLLNAAWLPLSLPPQLSWLLQGGSPVLFFQLSLLWGLSAAKRWSSPVGPSRIWWPAFPSSPFLWYSHPGKKRLWASYLFFSQCFPCLSGSMKWICIGFRKAALTVGCYQVGLGCCQELVWHTQLAVVLSCWPQRLWQDCDWDGVREKKATP